ncbi:MAG TPA: hypothetical protein VMX37_03940, partial [Acidimicrobiia bacterium]|nr:hypothetical protein [Acidimicrobiia bacterium]
MAEAGRRRRWWRVVLPAFLALAAAGWFARGVLTDAAGWAGARAVDAAAAIEGWATELRGMAEALPEDSADEGPSTGVSRSVLIALGAEQDGCAFALASVSAEGEVALTLLPQSLLGVVPGYGEFTLAEALVFEDADLVALTVTNLLGVRVDRVLALAPGSLAAALPAEVAVDLPVPLFAATGDGIGEVVAAGRQSVDRGAVERLLVDTGIGGPFEWLQRQGAAWAGVLGAVAADPAVADRLTAGMLAGAAEVAGVLEAVAAAEAAPVRSLPVEQAAAAGDEALVLSAGAMDGFVAAHLGHLLLRPGERARVEVLNGNGRIGATRLVAEAVVRRGFQV